MLLSDVSIRERLERGTIGISPSPHEDCLQPASVDLTLGRGITNPYGRQETVPDAPRGYKVHPGTALLMHTEEVVAIPPDIAARIEGKSTWGRQFLQVHSTAGFIDPGFVGQIVLEVVNLGPAPVRLVPGVPIAQICFYLLDRPAARPYGHPSLHSKYQGQMGAVAAR